MKNWLLMDRRKALLCALAWVISVVLHNLISAALQRQGLARSEEPFFFLLAVVVIPLYVLIAVTYTMVRHFSKPA